VRLLIDIGNSHIVIAIAKDVIKDVIRINTNKQYTAYEYSIFLDPVLDTVNFEGAIISSVVPEVTSSMNDYCMNFLGLSTIVIGPGVKTGINIKTDNPKEVGSDIICTSVAASEYDEALIVDLGTATTFTYVKNKVIKGVTIATGLKTSMKALINDTSLLHEISLEPSKEYLGTNTTDSLKIGLVNGHAYMVEGFIERIANENTMVILTGGFSKLVNSILDDKYTVNENLLLEGLNKIYSKNRRWLHALINWHR